METTRVVMGLFVAVLLPRSLPFVSRSRLAILLVCGTYGVYALAPVSEMWKWFPILIVALTWSYVIAWRWQRGESKDAFSVASSARKIAAGVSRGSVSELSALSATVRKILSESRSRNRIVVGVFGIATLLVFAVLINARSLLHFFHYFVLDNQVSIVVSGLIAAVFVSHEIVVRISSRFMEPHIAAAARIIEIDTFGVIIGWFERALVFAFIASGQADAAALALAAKSVARYPKMGDDPEFARYFLVGTFSSVIAAILWAVITRLALGIRPM